MASTITQRASSSSSSPPRWRYDAFLSFYGKDTRQTFTDHLYYALEQRGIIVFKDDKKLERGKYVYEELLKAIPESMYAIAVISANYASSRWCLIELAKFVECMRDKKLTILPIFYHVNPFDVRNQTGPFVEAFAKHEASLREKNPKFDNDDMQQWRVALREVGNISGWHVDDDRHESIVVEDISREILSGLSRSFSNVSNVFFGIESRVEEMMRLLSIGLDDVRILGIYGMGGIGKTTLSKFIYERVSHQFESSCFILGIREETRSTHGLIYLQKQLILEILMEREINIWNEYGANRVIANRLRNKKVLIVLDDVDGKEQLEALAGSRDWFGQGSRIIITSRDRHLLDIFVNDTYELKLLNDAEALRLFSWKAFKKPHPEENYVKLSKKFVNYAKGLPLALEVFGSYLFARDMDAWESARDFLKENPNVEILNKLKISFDGLEDLEKNLFLDIACFFNGDNINTIRHILQSFGYYLNINIKVLVDKSLLTIWHAPFLRMHDLLLKMGQKIVDDESKEPGGRSRLWRYKDVLHVLKNNTGTDAVEGIVLQLPLQKTERLNIEAFSKMKNLKMLRISDFDLMSTFSKLNDKLRTLEWHGDPSNFMLSNELCIMEWLGYPLESLPTSFESDNLVDLIMRRSYVKQLWDGSKSFVKLKRIDLTFSKNLIETPDLSEVPNLEELILYSCTSLSKVHPSIEFLRRLKMLDLQYCKRLERLPNIGGNMTSLQSLNLRQTAIKKLSLSSTSLSSLKDLILSDCSRLEEIPNDLSGMECLEEFKANGTSIRELPSSIVFLKKLKFLNVAGTNTLLSLNSFSGLSSLEVLLLGDCNLSDGAIPSDLSCLSSLVKLDLSGNKFKRLPDSVGQLSHLRKLNLRNCSWLQVLPKLPLKLEELYVANCPSLEMFYNMWTSNEKVRGIDCTFVADYVDYDGKPSTILRLHPRSSLWIKSNYFHTKVVCGPALLGSGIPEWFKDKSTTYFDLDLDYGSYEFQGYALFIVYQVHELKEHEHGSSNSRIFDGSNLNFPYFLCQFEVNEVDPEGNLNSPLVLCVPGDRSVGPSGFWVYIPARWFRRSRRSFGGTCSLWGDLWRWRPLCKASITKASITAGSQNVEVKECGARVVRQHDVSEFNQILNSISPHGFDLQSYENLFFHSDNHYNGLMVHGPIKGKRSTPWGQLGQLGQLQPLQS